jgi:hypothetical protein
MNLIQDKEEYTRESIQVDVQFKGKVRMDYEFYKVNPGDYEQFPIYTFYSGKCLAFKIKFEVINSQYVAFIMNRTKDLQVHAHIILLKIWKVGALFSAPIAILVVIQGTLLYLQLSRSLCVSESLTHEKLKKWHSQIFLTGHY